MSGSEFRQDKIMCVIRIIHEDVHTQRSHSDQDGCYYNDSSLEVVQSSSKMYVYIYIN